MSEEGNGGSNFGFFLAGLGMGAILALLFAPRSGKETREYIAGKAEEGRDYVKAKTEDLRRQAEGTALSSTGSGQASLPGRKSQGEVRGWVAKGLVSEPWSKTQG